MWQLTYSLLLLTTMLAWSGCSRAASQTVPAQGTGQSAAATQAEQAQDRLLGVKVNARFGVSALFYKSSGPAMTATEEVADYVLLRNDKTGQTSKPIKLDDNFENLQDVWSPNEEYLLLHCAGSSAGFCIYQADQLTVLMRPDSTFARDQMSDFIKVTFTETVRGEGVQQKPCQHRFSNWEGAATFVFKTRAYESKDGAGQFKYDIAARTLYGIHSYSFDGENMQGRLARPIPPSNVFRAQGAAPE